MEAAVKPTGMYLLCVLQSHLAYLNHLRVGSAVDIAEFQGNQEKIARPRFRPYILTHNLAGLPYNGMALRQTYRIAVA